MGYLVMFVITVLLFSSMRDALVIWACVPMALIGVTLRAIGRSMYLLAF